MRVGYFAQNYGVVSNPHSMNIDQLMHHTGHNTGNLAFWHAANLLFDTDEQVLVNWGSTADQLKDKIDLLVIPAANFLNHTSNLEAQAKLIEALDVPIIMMGIGAQSETHTEFTPLTDGTKRFLKVVSERTPFIGVRGDYSADLCRHYGINNVEVLGCPSILINPSKTLGETIEQRMSLPVERLLVHACCLKAPLLKTEATLFNALQQYSSRYIVQRPPELIKAILGLELNEDDMAYLEKFRGHVAGHLEMSEFLAVLRDKGESYMSVPEWLSRMRGFSHAIGTRIHGTLLPISVGVPSVCIYQDTRTDELSDTLKIPRISYKMFNKYSSNMLGKSREAVDFNRIFDSIEFSGEKFDLRRRAIAKKYTELFKLASLKSSRHLESIAE